MEDKKFEELMIAVRGKDLAEVRGEEVKRILEELLTGEFAGVKERKWKVMLKEPKGGGKASVNVVDGRVLLWINPDIRPESMRPVIRHELLHLETGMLDDADPEFKAIARGRGIDVWSV